MSSSYSYKGVPLNKIYTTNATGTYQGYSSFPIPAPATPSPFNYLRPKPFGYSGPNGDLRNFVDASNTGIITSSRNTVVPQNCKSIIVIAVGGGGGGGGAGGKATANPYTNSSKSAWGGDGGKGGFGEYVDTSLNIQPGDSLISIIIGNGGNGGLTSNEERVESSNRGGDSILGFNYNKNQGSASDGTVGNNGNATTIKIGTTILTASGGNGGYYGTGAYAEATRTNSNTSNGVPGASGNSIYTKYDGAPNMTYPNLGNAGNPGNGGTDGQAGVNAHTNGQPGTGGAVQIIWLYD